MASDPSSFNDESINNIYSFIKYSKATQSVSFKTLQKFVLSMSEPELKHMIAIYMNALLKTSTKHNPNGVTLKESIQNIKQPDQNTLDSRDQNILIKMKQSYGKKYNKKIMKRLQQNHPENKHLLSITPHILASTFQFLTFRELCKIQVTCSYFIYLHHSMNGQCNYYIDLNHNFWSNIMKNRISLALLTKFKYIRIDTIYNTTWNWETDANRKHALFMYVLKLIIKSSKSNLITLHIDVKNSYGWGYEDTDTYLLDHIMRNCECDKFEKLRTLTWDGDNTKVRTKALIYFNQIKQRFYDKFPDVNHFAFGIHRLREAFHLNAFQCSLDIAKYDNLASLDLKCTRFDVFKHNPGIIQILSKLTKLRKLHICTLYDYANTYSIQRNKIINTTLSDLHLELIINTRDPERRRSLSATIHQLLSSFVGINRFKFEYLSEERLHPRFDIILGFKCWENAFKSLFHQKALQIVNNGQNYPLETLDFDVSEDDAVSILQCLNTCRDEVSFDLKHFGLNVLCRERTRRRDYDGFIRNHFMPFLKVNKIKENLKSLRIGCCVPYHEINSYFDIWSNSDSIKIDVSLSDGNYWSDILSNIPVSLRELKIIFPVYSASEQKNIMMMNLVRRLSKLLSKNTGDSELNSIVLDNLKFCGEAERFLTFIFGYNNNFHVQDNLNKYYLSFK